MTPKAPNNYDPIAFFHWLWWKNLCHEASGTEFQHLFEKAASHLYPGFIRIKPRGKLGDRKSDGFYWKKGTLFQVYSPDELRERETLKKITKDLKGAVEEWKDDLKKWVFVFNTR